MGINFQKQNAGSGFEVARSAELGVTLLIARIMHYPRSRVMIVQPALMHYRRVVYDRLSILMEVTVVCPKGSVEKGNSDFDIVECPLLKWRGLTWQKGIVGYMLHLRPEALWLAADANGLSSLALTVVARLTGTKVILHGQGLLKRSRYNIFRKIAIRTWIMFAHVYVGYTSASMQSLLSAGAPQSKLYVIPNRLETSSPVPHSTLAGEGKGVLFVGRLREGSQIEILIEAMRQINNKVEHPLPLHIVGDGKDRASLEQSTQSLSWLRWHGHVIDETKLADIAKYCALGVYPGQAGLSVLTFMKYGLPVIVGNDLSRHMGPEPSYVNDGKNGWTFEHDNLEDFIKVLRQALNSSNLSAHQQNALDTFRQLHRKSYGEEMGRFIQKVINL